MTDVTASVGVGAETAGSERFRILVVEDSFLVVLAIESFLEELGWIMVGPATRKADALVMARAEEVDAALLDIDLHGERSWDVASVLMERGIPFVFTTGYDVEGLLPARLAACRVLGKPFRERELAEALRSVIFDGRSDRSAATPVSKA